MAEHNQQFDSYDEWLVFIEKTQMRPLHHAVCFDSIIRPCVTAKDFRRARDENAFPVRWYWPEQVAEIIRESDERNAWIRELEEEVQEWKDACQQAENVRVGIEAWLEKITKQRDALREVVRECWEDLPFFEAMANSDLASWEKGQEDHEGKLTPFGRAALGLDEEPSQ